MGEPGPEPPLTPVPEAPEPEATESCEVFGRRRKSECNRKPSGSIFQKKGKRCLRTPSNGGKCTVQEEDLHPRGGPVLVDRRQEEGLVRFGGDGDDRLEPCAKAAPS